MFGNLTGWHALILLVIVLLLFGATKLPALAKSVGQSAKIFKSEMKTGASGEPVAAGATGADAAPDVVGGSAASPSARP